MFFALGKVLIYISALAASSHLGRQAWKNVNKQMEAVVSHSIHLYKIG
jgi:hypothetical protein